MPVVTLLTDFGARDAYVGMMKGVIVARCPQESLVDLTHEVAPGDVAAAAYLLSTAWRYFPTATVHLAVVDPGVGGDRKALVAEAGGQFFVGPDNGLFTQVFTDAPPSRVVSIENEAVFLKHVSRTFHGRDIFAPAAAALAAGAAIESLGPAARRWQSLSGAAPWRSRDGTLIGQVIHADRFGNLITNLRDRDLPVRPAIRIGGRELAGLAATYESVPAGELLALIGSSGRLEISVNRGSAAEMLGVGPGTQVAVHDVEATP